MSLADGTDVSALRRVSQGALPCIDLIVGLTKCVKATIRLALCLVSSMYKQWIIEENLLCFSHCNPVLVVLADVSVIPIEVRNFGKVNHNPMLSRYT